MSGPTSDDDDRFPRTTLDGEVDDSAAPGFSTADDAVTRDLLFPEGDTETAEAARDLAYGGEPHLPPPGQRNGRGG